MTSSPVMHTRCSGSLAVIYSLVSPSLSTVHWLCLHYTAAAVLRKLFDVIPWQNVHALKSWLLMDWRWHGDASHTCVTAPGPVFTGWMFLLFMIFLDTTNFEINVFYSLQSASLLLRKDFKKDDFLHVQPRQTGRRRARKRKITYIVHSR